MIQPAAALRTTVPGLAAAGATGGDGAAFGLSMLAIGGDPATAAVAGDQPVTADPAATGNGLPAGPAIAADVDPALHWLPAVNIPVPAPMPGTAPATTGVAILPVPVATEPAVLAPSIPAAARNARPPSPRMVVPAAADPSGGAIPAQTSTDAQPSSPPALVAPLQATPLPIDAAPVQAAAAVMPAPASMPDIPAPPVAVASDPKPSRAVPIAAAIRTSASVAAIAITAPPPASAATPAGDDPETDATDTPADPTMGVSAALPAVPVAPTPADPPVATRADERHAAHRASVASVRERSSKRQPADTPPSTSTTSAYPDVAGSPAATATPVTASSGDGAQPVAPAPTPDGIAPTMVTTAAPIQRTITTRRSIREDQGATAPVRTMASGPSAVVPTAPRSPGVTVPPTQAAAVPQSGNATQQDASTPGTAPVTAEVVPTMPAPITSANPSIVPHQMTAAAAPDMPTRSIAIPTAPARTPSASSTRRGVTVAIPSVPTATATTDMISPVRAAPAAVAASGASATIAPPAALPQGNAAPAAAAPPAPAAAATLVTAVPSATAQIAPPSLASASATSAAPASPPIVTATPTTPAVTAVPATPVAGVPMVNAAPPLTAPPAASTAPPAATPPSSAQPAPGPVSEARRTVFVREVAGATTQAVTIAPSVAPTPLPAPGLKAPAAQVFGAAIRAAQTREDAPVVDTAAPTAGTMPLQPTVAPLAADTGRPTLDMRQDRWPGAMIDHIETLRDNADASSTRIRLVPDALGTIDVALRKEGDTLHVHFTAEQAATRSLLQDAQPHLAQAAQDRGIRLGDTQVSAATGQSTGQSGDQPRGQPDQPRGTAADSRGPAMQSGDGQSQSRQQARQSLATPLSNRTPRAPTTDEAEAAAAGRLA